MTVFLVLSPLPVFHARVYAVLGFCGWPHRLASILSSRREHLLPRLAVIGFWLIALVLMVFTNISSNTHFTDPPPCDTLAGNGTFAAVLYSLCSIPYIGVAIVILVVIEIYEDGNTSTGVIGIASTPLFLLVTALVWAVIKSRVSLIEKVRMLNIDSRPKRFWAYWKLFGARYPLLHFCGVFLVPMIYWVILNEIRLLGTPDNVFSPSFGQVLAVFVVFQPLLQVLKMFPRAIRWLSNLTIIRLITGRQKKLVHIPLTLQAENSDMVSVSGWDKYSE
ncbi:hypothetical protein B0H12DRAFT_1071005 [Mycena haematopus]|nr:hypothetical protein B0H12DRAFT_1071005 [Mycena haematopus]